MDGKAGYQLSKEKKADSDKKVWAYRMRDSLHLVTLAPSMLDILVPLPPRFFPSTHRTHHAFRSPATTSSVVCPSADACDPAPSHPAPLERTPAPRTCGVWGRTWSPGVLWPWPWRGWLEATSSCSNNVLWPWPWRGGVMPDPARHP